MIRTYLLAQLYDITYKSGAIAANQRLPDASGKILHAKSVSDEAVILYPVNGRWQSAAMVQRSTRREQRAKALVFGQPFAGIADHSS